MELALISNEELAVKVREKQRRMSFIQTEQGKLNAVKLMLELFEYLRMSGYKLPDADSRKMAEVWADQLSQYLVEYGPDVLKDATRNFVLNDNREYRQTPNASQIIAEAKKIGYNPDAELAKRRHEQFVEEMKNEQRERTKAELTDEKRKEYEERFPNLAAAMKGVLHED